jgi:hypothetical protein
VETRIAQRLGELPKKYEKDLPILDALIQWSSNPTSASAGYALEENIRYIRVNLESRYGSRQTEKAISCLKAETDSLIKEFNGNIYQVQKEIGRIISASAGKKLSTAMLRRFRKLSPDERKRIAIFISEFLSKESSDRLFFQDYMGERFKVLCNASSEDVESSDPFSTLIACGIVNKLLWLTTKRATHEPLLVPDFAKPILSKMLDETLPQMVIPDVKKYIEQLVERKMFEQLRLLDELLCHNLVGDGSTLNTWARDLYKVVSAKGIIGKYRTLVAVSPLVAGAMRGALTDAKSSLVSELRSNMRQLLVTLRDEAFPEVGIVETQEGWIVELVDAVPLTVTVEPWLLDEQARRISRSPANLVVVTNESLPSISTSLQANKVDNVYVLAAAERKLSTYRFGNPHTMVDRIFSKLLERGYTTEPLKASEEVKGKKEEEKLAHPPPESKEMGKYEVTFDTTVKDKKVFGRGELEDKLALGYEIQDNQVKYDRIVTVDLYDLNKPHFAALQQVGMGKSTLAGSIMLQAAFQGIPVVVFDPKPDYISNLVPVTTLLERKPSYIDKIKPRFDSLKQDMKGFNFGEKVPIRDKEMQLEFNVFSFNEKLRSLRNVKVLKMPLVTLPTEEEDFDSACGHIATSLANLITAVTRKNYRESNILINRIIKEFSKNHLGEAAITYSQFIDSIDELNKKPSSKSEKTELQKLRKGTESFYLAQPNIYAKSDEQLVDVGEIVKNPTFKDGDRRTVSISVIDVSSLSQEKGSPMLSNYVSEVCNLILKFIRMKSAEKPVRLIVVFDEAQNYLPRPTDAYSGVRKILDMGRSLGIRAWIISPSPGNIEQKALDQIATFVCAKLRPEQIRNYIANLVSDDGWITKMQQTETGRALVFNERTKPSGQLILPFTTPQTVNLLRPEEVLELMSGSR